MTFSRGGVLTGIFSLILSVFVYIRMGRGSRQFSKLFFGMVIFAALSYFLWGIINIYTNNSVSRRYGNTLKSGKEGAGQSGSYMDRLNIATQDLKAFEAHPILGNGPEGSHQFRAKNFNTDLAAHTEFTRLLGDHGLFGLVALLILVCSPYYYYNRRKGDNKIILIGFIAISFLTMFHAAMRLAIPGLAFGLALIDVNLQDHPLERYG